jgi:hypothetical protein
MFEFRGGDMRYMTDMAPASLSTTRITLVRLDPLVST